jgi:hypothetical protein
MLGACPLGWEIGAAGALSWFLEPLGTRASTPHTWLLLALSHGSSCVKFTVRRFHMHRAAINDAQPLLTGPFRMRPYWATASRQTRVYWRSGAAKALLWFLALLGTEESNCTHIARVGSVIRPLVSHGSPCLLFGDLHRAAMNDTIIDSQ